MALIDDLSAKFPAKDVKDHPTKTGKDNKPALYLPVEKYEERLNEVFGVSWEWVITDSVLDFDKRTAKVTGFIRYPDDAGNICQKGGVGAAQDNTKGQSREYDDIIKMAASEALKNAGRQLGIGLYLYSADDRQEVYHERRNGSAPKPAPAKANDPHAEAYTRLARAAKAAAAKSKLPADQIPEAMRLALLDQCKVQSSKEADAAQLSDLAKLIEATPTYLPSLLMKGSAA